MPRYLIVHSERRGDDTVIEDPDLTVEFVDGWVLFRDCDLIKPDRVALAIPAAQVQRVERVDEPQDQQRESAPHEE
ncbi:hypothetical protein [Streptomyces scabiei]|uniref:hypothetical protein n=1 Tax=Streptomyces scabiei TaxID=1930 RepID=UPI000765FEA6|nr:hypothetical protein [Streptomyces scabiei]